MCTTIFIDYSPSATIEFRRAFTSTYSCYIISARMKNWTIYVGSLIVFILATTAKLLEVVFFKEDAASILSMVVPVVGLVSLILSGAFMKIEKSCETEVFKMLEVYASSFTHTPTANVGPLSGEGVTPNYDVVALKFRYKY